LIYGPIPTATNVTVVIPATPSTPTETPLANIGRGDVNLTHLNFLVEDVDIAGQPMAITHIYSEYPRYEWVDASGEGIAAVDDAARAALVYLDDYEYTHDSASLDKARRLLNFVLYMQAEDGQFYNFILDRAGTINQTGNTSFKTSGWWATGRRALGAGYGVMHPVIPLRPNSTRLFGAFVTFGWARWSLITESTTNCTVFRCPPG
jgi:hypothetical protein